MKVAIIYTRFLKETGDDYVLGGVESYIHQLGVFLFEKNYTPIVFQCATHGFNRNVSNIQVIGVPVSNKTTHANALYNESRKHIDITQDIVIFASEMVYCKNSASKEIVIQHGIGWDLPSETLSNRFLVKTHIGGWIQKIRYIKSRVSFMKYCKNLVCVDFNYLNWYKATFPKWQSVNITVIPNFTAVPSEFIINKKLIEKIELSILFARRFTEYRGVNIMISVAEIILEEFKNVRITFAGEGPLEQLIKTSFCNNSRVRVTKYNSKDSIKVHLEHDIAVVPSLGSEGTSLAVAEAMASGMAIVATSVGGITNMIIDNHNGLLTMPTTSDVENALRKLIIDSNLRIRLGRCAYETAKNSFSTEKWCGRWSDLLNTLA